MAALKPPTDRPVIVISTDEDLTYHVYAEDDGRVAVLVGCRLVRFTNAEAWRMARALVRPQ